MNGFIKCFINYMIPTKYQRTERRILGGDKFHRNASFNSPSFQLAFWSLMTKKLSKDGRFSERENLRQLIN